MSFGSIGSWVRSIVTDATGSARIQYQRYSDFKDLTPEKILKLPLEQISRTNLKKDRNTVLKPDQLSAVRKLIAIKNFSKTIKDESRRKSMVEEARENARRSNLKDSEIDDFIVDTYTTDILPVEVVEAGRERLKDDTPLTDEQVLQRRVLNLKIKKGGRRNTKKTKMQTKKRTNKKKRRTYKK